MASVPMDIVEIRRTVYGKAMREPIADALTHLKDKYINTVVKRLNSVEIRAVKDYDDEFYIDSGGVTDLLVTGLENNNYLLTDNRGSDSVDLIEGTDYLYEQDNLLWTSVMINDEDRDYYLILHY